MKAPGLHETRPFVWNTQFQQIARGRTNSTGEMTLAAGVTSTQTLNDCVNVDDTILFTAMTPDAAAEIGGGTFYLSAVEKGAFTVTHANSISEDRTFRYAIFGG